MTIETRTTPPTRIIAGDTDEFSVSPVGFRASDGGTLEFSLSGTTVMPPLEGTPNGDAWDFVLTTTVTKTLQPGSYRWRLRITQDGRTRTIDEGQTLVLKDLSTLGDGEESPLDETLIPILRSALAGTLEGEMLDYMIGGRQVRLIPPKDLLELLEKMEGRRDARLSRGNRAGILFGTRNPHAVPDPWSC